MPDIAVIIQAGAANPWLYLPAALVLGALHALEPGHSKAMTAAFLIAVRGTVTQAVLLGISAAVGHTIIVWALALAGLALGERLIADKAEPWLVLISGLLIMALAFRIFWMLRPRVAHREHGDHDHPHGHEHPHDGASAHHHGDHAHDAHTAAHAREVGARRGDAQVTNLDVAWFGFTGGLLPCPSAIAVLLVCLQLNAFTLGVTMVAAFSVGLAVTLVAVGIAAVWSTRAVAARWSGLGRLSARLPYVSAGIVFTVGALITLRGLSSLGVV